MNFYYGIVENRDDPLKIGRCQVRIVGLHTHDKTILPTSDLPWSTPLQPVTSAGMNGIGTSPIGPVEGTTVVIIFADVDQQQPIMMGTLGGVPQSKAAEVAEDDSRTNVLDSTDNNVTDISGNTITTTLGTPVEISSNSKQTRHKRAACCKQTIRRCS